ncbi:hypothetical protein R6Z07F_012036 [Ovis aries]|nr:CASP-like protein 4A1 [Ovis aries]
MHGARKYPWKCPLKCHLKCPLEALQRRKSVKSDETQLGEGEPQPQTPRSWVKGRGRGRGPPSRPQRSRASTGPSLGQDPGRETSRGGESRAGGGPGAAPRVPGAGGPAPLTSTAARGAQALGGDSCAGQLRGGGREASRSGGCSPARVGGWGGSGVSPGRPSRHADVGRSARGSASRCEEGAWWETHPRTRIQTPEAPGLLFPTRRLGASAHLTPPPPHLPRLTSPFLLPLPPPLPSSPKKTTACVAGGKGAPSSHPPLPASRALRSRRRPLDCRLGVSTTGRGIGAQTAVPPKPQKPVSFAAGFMEKEGPERIILPALLLPALRDQ